jgi:hypothetical protein
MKHLTTSILIISLLAGCSSITKPLGQSAKVQEFAGGATDSNKTTLFWLTERSGSPVSNFDDVKSIDTSWYKSHYSWNGDNLSELSRVGERLANSGKLVPYQITLRFSRVGEAVYQRQDINGKVMPMRSEQIDQIKAQANELIALGKLQQKSRLELIQGYWSKGAFTTCAGERYSSVDFKEGLPQAEIDNLQHEEKFSVFMGGYQAKKVLVEQILFVQNSNSNTDCIERPNLG